MTQRINADFGRRVLVHGDQLPWVDSPVAGVQRRPLDRVGGEVARATSLVRYAPGSQFSAHVHSGGEELLVLEGVFQDEHGDFPAGSYIRNPPASSHTPGSASGCTIFVKLWQFDPDDDAPVRIATEHLEPAGDIRVSELHRDHREVVKIVGLEPGRAYRDDADGGAEILVLQGCLDESNDRLQKYSWLRLPVGSNLDITAGGKGAVFWLKCGHLKDIDAQLEHLGRTGATG